MQETEADTRANRIDPILREAGWGMVEGSTIQRELTITPGRIIGGGERAGAILAQAQPRDHTAATPLDRSGCRDRVRPPARARAHARALGRMSWRHP